MLRAHRSTFKPDSGCTLRQFLGATAMSVGLGSDTDAAFDLSDEFDDANIILANNAPPKKYHVPRGTSKIRIFLGGEGNDALCASFDNPCDDGGVVECPVGTPCCPAEVGLCCRKSDGACDIRTKVSCYDENREGGPGNCWKPGNFSDDDLPEACRFCGKACCIDKCDLDEGCIEDQLCFPEDCQNDDGKVGEPIPYYKGTCNDNCVPGSFFVCLQPDFDEADPIDGGYDPDNFANPDTDCNAGASKCSCQPIGECDEDSEQDRNVWKAFGYSTFDTQDECVQECYPRWRCCTQGTSGTRNCDDKGTIDESGNRSCSRCREEDLEASACYCTKRACGVDVAADCQGETPVFPYDNCAYTSTLVPREGIPDEVSEGQILTVEQLTFLNKGQPPTLSTATPITKAQANAYNARVRSLSAVSIQPVSAFANRSSTNVYDVFIDPISDEQAFAQGQKCNICEGPNPPSGGITVLCDIPLPALVVYEYDVKDLCDSTDLELAIFTQEFGGGNSAYPDPNRRYYIYLGLASTSLIPFPTLAVDVITKGQTPKYFNANASINCTTCQLEAECDDDLLPVIDGEYVSFQSTPPEGIGAPEYQTGFDVDGSSRLLNTRSYVVPPNLIDGQDFTLKTTVFAAGEKLSEIMHDSNTLELIPTLNGGSSEDDPADADYGKLVNRFRWDLGRIESETEGTTFAAGNAEGALSSLYHSVGLGDCANEDGDLETPGPMFFGAVMTDIGYDFPAGLVSNTEEYNRREIVQDFVLPDLKLFTSDTTVYPVTGTSNYETGIYTTDHEYTKLNYSSSSEFLVANASNTDAIIHLYHGPSADGIPQDGQNNFAKLQDAQAYADKYIFSLRAYNRDRNANPNDFDFTNYCTNPPTGFSSIDTIGSTKFLSFSSVPVPVECQHSKTINGSFKDKIFDLQVRITRKPRWQDQADMIFLLRKIAAEDLIEDSGDERSTMLPLGTPTSDGNDLDSTAGNSIYRANVRNLNAGESPSSFVDYNGSNESSTRYGSFGDLGSNRRFPRTYELSSSEILTGLSDSLESYAPYVAVYSNGNGSNPAGWYVYQRTGFESNPSNQTSEGGGNAIRVEYRNIVDSVNSGVALANDNSDLRGPSNTAIVITLKNYNKGDFEFWDAPVNIAE